MLRRTSVRAVLLSLVFALAGVGPSQAVPGPGDTSIHISNAKIYPAINNAKRPGSTVIEVLSVSPSEIVTLEIHGPGGNVVRTFTFPSPELSTRVFNWSGRDDSNALVPAGTYTVHLYDGSHVEVDTTGVIAVSRQRLVQKSLTRFFLPTQRVFKYAGRCSTMAQPSKRGWKGSVGYYSNTRCGTQTWRASAVITGHYTRLPVAERYGTVRVDTYGGAAKSRPGSRGGLDYSGETGWTAFKFAGSKVGWHTGLTALASDVVDTDRYFAWRFATAYKGRYDVAKFRLVVYYTVLSPS